MPTDAGVPETLFYLDEPTAPPAEATMLVQGWLGSSAPVERVAVVAPDADPAIDIALVDRPDVRRLVTEATHIAGFRAEIPAACAARGTIELIYHTGGREYRFTRNLTGAIDPQVKAAKLARIEPLLRRDLPHVRHSGHFDFLTPELRERFRIVDTDAVSSNSYDATALGLISRHANGLILDAGAGCTADYRANVVNFEIVPYPSTDVLGVGEVLPFVDDAFDAVFSLAVLEHVTDPFQCARELQRVLKPGGRLYAVVPFLQPYHGYPHHYYNMTHQGLANLFPGLEVVSQSVPLSGRPIWTLQWYLQAWCDGLSPEVRDTFRSMRVADLLGNPATFLSEPFVAGLGTETNLRLASTTALVAVKPAGS